MSYAIHDLISLTMIEQQWPNVNSLLCNFIISKTISGEPITKGTRHNGIFFAIQLLSSGTVENAQKYPYCEIHQLKISRIVTMF